MTIKQSIREILIFSFPIIFGQIGIMLINTGDNIVAGQYSTEALAAIGLATSLGNPILVVGLGFLFGVSPMLARMRGEGKEITSYFGSVLTYSLFVGIVFSLICFMFSFIVDVIDYGEKLNFLIKQYLQIVSSSILFVALYQGMKEFFQAKEKTFWPNFICLCGAGLNFFLNVGLVFGKWGLPKLDEAGLAWASWLIRLLMTLAFFIWCLRQEHISRWTIDWGFIAKMLRNGFPIAAGVCLEVTAFSVVALLAGKFGATQAAANSLAINLASLTFMVPLAISSAVSVKVGHSWGEKHFHFIKIYSYAGLSLSVGFMFFSALSLSFFPEFFIQFFSKDLDLIHWAGKLLFVVGVFQIFDGTQVTLTGILRGLERNREASMGLFIGYWILGIPLGVLLAFYFKLESLGLWMGLAIALAATAGVLSYFVRGRWRELKVH